MITIRPHQKYAILSSLLVFALVSLLTNNVSAETKDTSGFVPNSNLTLRAKSVPSAIKIDGEIDDAGWASAERAVNFSQNNPVDGVRPPVKTVAMVAFDQDFFYGAAICYCDPSEVRRTMADRDQIWSDDGVSFLVDTYGSGAWLYEFFVNPLGIQGDSRWTQSFGFDTEFDIVYYSAGKVTDSGYQVEIAVPFSSMRFPDQPKQTWRVNFWQNYPRETQRDFYWCNISKDNNCYPCQFGTLEGIENIEPGAPLELLPSFVGYQASQLSNFDDPKSGFDNGNPDGEFSLGARYALTTSLSAEASFNPDFSQVESDAGQIDVNSTFALFYPEKRPFFQEGGDLYQTWIQTVYTRQINNPQFATKLTGRMGKTSVGYIGALDETTPILMPFEERSRFVSAEKSYSNIARIRHNYGQNSSIGMLVTDRRLVDGGAGSTVSADGTLGLSNTWRVEWQGVVSRTEEPDDTSMTSNYNGTTFDNGKHTVDFDGETYNGHAWLMSLERGARFWNVNLDFFSYSPTFRADNGFETRNSVRFLDGWTGVVFRRNEGYFELVEPSVSFGRIWNWDGIRKDEWLRPNIFARIKGRTYVEVGRLWSREVFRGKEFPNIRVVDINFGSAYGDVIRFGGGIGIERGVIARNLNDPTEGDGIVYAGSATIKPMDRFVIQPSFRTERLERKDNGDRLFHASVLRTQFNYQFTKELFLRLVVQFYREDVNDEVDPAVVYKYRSVSLEPLLTYRVNPYTLFYVGSNHAFEDGNFNSTWESQNGLTQTSRQFFMKLQYLFKM